MSPKNKRIVILYGCLGLMVLTAIILREASIDGNSVPVEKEEMEGGERATQATLSQDETRLTAPTSVDSREMSSDSEENTSSLTGSTSTGLAQWRGMASREFLSYYWKVPQDEMVKALREDGMPERMIERMLEKPVTEQLVEWAEAKGKIKEQLVAAIEADEGNIETAYSQAWGGNLRSFTDSLTQLLQEQYQASPFQPTDLYEAILNVSSGVLTAYSTFLDAEIRLGLHLLDTDDVDKFPVLTVPQGRGKQSASRDGAGHYKYLSLTGGGWIAQFALWKGASGELDQSYLALTETWKSAVASAVQNLAGVQISPQTLSGLGMN